MNELERQVRALNPWPGAFMEFDGTILKIHHAHVGQIANLSHDAKIEEGRG
ncbi:MAG: hypothetical protein U0V48_12020 [Anaerolineales bacterium]